MCNVGCLPPPAPQINSFPAEGAAPSSGTTMTSTAVPARHQQIGRKNDAKRLHRYQIQRFHVSAVQCFVSYLSSTCFYFRVTFLPCVSLLSGNIGVRAARRPLCTFCYIVPLSAHVDRRQSCRRQPEGGSRPSDGVGPILPIDHLTTVSFLPSPTFF